MFYARDVILFHAGDSWNGELAPRGSGTEGHPIVIDSYGKGNSPVIHGPGTNDSAAVLLKDQSYWEINHLELTNTSATGTASALRGIYVLGSSSKDLWHHIYIRNCYVHDVNSEGYGKSGYSKMSGGIIFAINIQGALIEGCHVANVDVEGIRNSSPLTTSNFVIRHNVVENVYGDGIVLHGSSGGSRIEYNVVHSACMSDAANYAAVWTYASRHTLIQFNEVYGTTAGGPNDGEVFDADIDTDGDVFQYNYSHDNARGFMLLMASAKNIIVRYNISQNDAMSAARQGGHRLFYQDGKVGSISNRIYNNTFYEGSLDTVFFQSKNVFFDNNILYSTGTVKQFSTTPLSDASEFENNLFFPSIMTAVHGLAGTVLHNISSDPLWKARGTGIAGLAIGRNGFLQEPTGYMLRRGSPANHAGRQIDANVGFDYYGNHVLATNTPSIGAYDGPAVNDH
ncbi:right-handed parallel beta-helix repeat-containing protein [Edaphobacter acidisoli]|nr:right-handed parallel beta-helix repeat-containing protein [Edaphobacter acidisoli]